MASGPWFVAHAFRAPAQAVAPERRPPPPRNQDMSHEPLSIMISFMN